MFVCFFLLLLFFCLTISTDALYTHTKAEMKIFFVISVLVLFCGLTIGLVREHIYVNYVNHMEWDDAQTYCRQHYKDLSIITSEEENQVLIEAAGNSLTDSWIGLYRAKRNLWLWSDGQSVSFFKWANGPPYNSSGSPNCCSMDKRGWDGNYCTRNLPFFCYRTLVLVNENKTWDEAHEYCRTHYTGLAGLASDSQLYLDKTDTNFSQAATVWAGLRFLDGQ
uniref:C-type lectin domain-containing protein n=1 Tax=Electrophorus electricus TaxID=8005 RepID=A0A4W4DST0_ELEEL